MAKLTPEILKSKIISENYHQFDGTTVTVCCLTLENDFSAIGHSACIDFNEFDAVIGEKTAYNNAFSKLWELYGFADKEITHQLDRSGVLT